MKNVCFLFGINGVGKSTLARAVAAAVPGASLVSSSETLRNALGGMTREELELADPKVKQEMLRKSLLRAFEERKHSSVIFCDKHLLVPIRTEGSLRYECMWDDSYDDHARSLCYVTAPQESIAERRQRDIISGERVRRCSSIDEITLDENMNHEAFTGLFGGRSEAFKIINDGSLDTGVQALLSRLAA